MNRRSFLSAAAATIAAVCAATALSSAAFAAGDGAVASYETFLATARTPAKHKQLFTSPRANNGAIFAYMRNSLNGYQFGWSEGPGTLHAAAVLNGLGVAQGVNDEMWSRYHLAAVLASNNDVVKAPGADRGNPWLHAAKPYPRDDADPNAPYNQDASVETLLRRGATIYICNNALRQLALKTAEAGFAGGLSTDALHAEFRRNLVPGGILVPAGVTTIDALQQEHFTLYDASV
ncbi:MAG: Tat pathway signal sequence domain protein [Candidatus Eremiobacteraeota bacterium]|nr:Tat pathway signal sequence domain protein [Candidatus Eremiobacteraeota bacterium]